MNIFLKRLILLFILVFTSTLYADFKRITISDATSVNESNGPLIYTIELSRGPFRGTVVVDYSTQNGSAQAGSDYIAKSGTISFARGETSRTISIDVLNDAIHEGTQSVYVNITSSRGGYRVTDGQGYGLILDDDLADLELTIADRTESETDANRVIQFTPRLNRAAPVGGVVVNYETRDGSALAGSDYVAKTGSLTIPAGSINGTIEIETIGDTITEGSESFTLNITSIASVTIIDGEALCTINDDDAIEVDISCSDAQEGALGESNDIICRIFLAKPYPAGETPFTVNYAAQDGSSPSALVADDYLDVHGTVIFSPGEQEKIINIPTIGDNNVEPDENVKMILSGSPHIIDFDSEAEIINDDGAYPGFEFDTTDFNITEGDAGQKSLDFTFTLDSPAIAGMSFDYYTQDDEATIANNDYDAIATTTYAIPLNATNITISVQINGDTNIENDETFYLKIENEQGIVVHGHTAKGHIINDDGSFPALTFNAVNFSEMEEDAGTREINVTMTLDAPALAGTSFDYITSDGTAKISNSDYIALASTTYNIPLNATQITIPVTINGDTEVEVDEEFYFTIFNEQNLTLPVTTTVAIEILNDDAAAAPVNNIGEFRFDDCGADEWRIDSSSTGNDTFGPGNIVTNDGKSQMCTSQNGLSSGVQIAHNPAYALDSGTYSVMLYDHHNTWANSWLIKKGNFVIEVKRVGGDANKGTVTFKIGANVIATNDVYFTNSDGTDLDSQWIHVSTTFGNDGMKFYIDGELKGTHAYTGGLSGNTANIQMTRLSGYYDEFYIFDGQMDDNQVRDMYNNVLSNNNIDGTSRDCGCGVVIETFTCDKSMYISSDTNRETSATGRMWLHKIDTTTNPFDFNVVDSVGANELYNAIAYNHDDDYIYGLFNRELIQLSNTGQVNNLGIINGLHSDFDTAQLYAGAIYDGYYYVTGPGIDFNKIFKINLSNKTVTDITLDIPVSISDFSFYKDSTGINDGKFLYGVADGGTLKKVEVATGIVTSIGAAHVGYQFDSSFSDMNGRFFANDSNGNGFFEFNLQTGEKNFISNSQPATYNDGANCLNAALVFNDFGDAPSTYGTPRHTIVNGMSMGTEIDHDVAAYTSIDAMGDDNNGIDDEDGITLTDGSDINGSYFEPNTLQEFNINVSTNGFLNAWVDYNADGDFLDAGEKIFSATALTAGTHTLSFTIPAVVSLNQSSYMRFRFSSASLLNSTENASDGEVEDYEIKLGTDALTGRFNIERTNSASFLPIMTDERNAWYTQVVGKDFDYSVVFYEDDFSAEKNVTNVTVKIDLMDMDTNTSLYRYVYHFPDTFVGSRKEFTVPIDDLASLPATKNARFRVTYGVDPAGNVVQANCAQDPSLCSQYRPDDAFDNFAIRPENFYISIADNNQIRKENTTALSDPLRVAAGYEYNLSVIATKYPSNDYNTSLGYDANVMGALEFIPSGNCADESNGTININNTTFVNGTFNNLNFTHNNVGNFILKVKDTTWTEVDANKSQCTPNNSNIANDTNYPSGCDINTISDVNLSFYPYRFEVDFDMNNLPDSGHDDFIYMSDLNLSEQNISFQLLGSITAQNENNETTTNFTRGCVAENVQLITDTNIRTEDGNVLPIQTSVNLLRGRENINISRMVRFNDEPLVTTEFTSMPNNNIFQLNISEDEFIDEQNGSIDLDLRYNIQKHLSLTINPVQITFNSLDASSPLANSTAEGEVAPNYIPEGSQELNNTIRNFYFSRVSPDSVSYPKIHFSALNNAIRTPLNVEIFCDRSNIYCSELAVTNNTDTTGLSNVQDGWYISSNHNTANDGIVQNLTSAAHVTMIPDNNISFTLGRNGLIVTTFNACVGRNDQAIIQIIPDDSLLYHENPINNGIPNYTVSCTDNNTSELSGIGQTGNLVGSKANEDKTSRIDW